MTHSERRGGNSSNGFNLVPFAVMAGGWLAPLLMFWLYVWGPLRPYSYPPGDLLPTLPWTAAALAATFAAGWLPAAYYRVHSFERSGAVYVALGARAFRALVPDGDLARTWLRRRARDARLVRHRSQAREFVGRTILVEKSHLVLLVFGAASSLHALQIGWSGWALYLAIGNLITNAYPILLQRFTRAQLNSILTRRSA